MEHSDIKAIVDRVQLPYDMWITNKPFVWGTTMDWTPQPWDDASHCNMIALIMPVEDVTGEGNNQIVTVAQLSATSLARVNVCRECARCAAD